jgi:hypothetical protein
MMLEVSDILQIDATIIVGVLILLTITSYKVSPIDAKKFFRGFTKEGMTALIVTPFAISAMITLGRCMNIASDMLSPISDCSLISADLILPVGGFFYLFLVVVLIARAARVKINS